MSGYFNDEWPIDVIWEKYESGQALSGNEALALLASKFSNATHGNYSAESLFERINTDFSITIKKY